eukprot:scaffold888_cov246-Pinguiococcus_pyrenoidosus.AAC.6
MARNPRILLPGHEGGRRQAEAGAEVGVQRDAQWRRRGVGQEGVDDVLVVVLGDAAELGTDSDGDQEEEGGEAEEEHGGGQLDAAGRSHHRAVREEHEAAQREEHEGEDEQGRDGAHGLAGVLVEAQVVPRLARRVGLVALVHHDAVLRQRAQAGVVGAERALEVVVHLLQRDERPGGVRLQRDDLLRTVQAQVRDDLRRPVGPSQHHDVRARGDVNLQLHPVVGAQRADGHEERDDGQAKHDHLDGHHAAEVARGLGRPRHQRVGRPSGGARATHLGQSAASTRAIERPKARASEPQRVNTGQKLRLAASHRACATAGQRARRCFKRVCRPVRRVGSWNVKDFNLHLQPIGALADVRRGSSPRRARLPPLWHSRSGAIARTVTGGSGNWSMSPKLHSRSFFEQRFGENDLQNRGLALHAWDSEPRR